MVDGSPHSEHPPMTPPIETKPPEVKSPTEKKVEKAQLGIMESLKNFGGDLAQAYKIAGASLDSGDLGKQLLTGATVAGTGLVMEKVSDALFDNALDALVSKIGYKYEGKIKVAGSPDKKVTMKASTIRSDLASADGGGTRKSVMFDGWYYQDNDRPVEVPKDQQPTNDQILGDFLKKRKITSALIRPSGAKEILTDTMVAMEYGVLRRVLGFSLPEVTATHLGITIVNDLAYGMWGDVAKKHDLLPKQRGGTLRNKAGGFVDTMFNKINPVTLLGSGMIWDGVKAYTKAFDSVRKRRELVDKGVIKPNQVYVGEGNASKPWERKSGGYKGGRRG